MSGFLRPVPLAPLLHSVLLPAALVACASYEPRPLDLDGVSTEVAVRGATPGQLSDALQLADLRALPFERPQIDAESVAYDHQTFWLASALAFNGELRSARRRWAEASARARSGGAPMAAELEVEQTGFDSADRETWIALTFDVLGILDAGRAGAARELAEAEARTALADVERAAWSARIAVDRARAGVGSSLATIEQLVELLDSSKASVRRAELLFERGRLSEGELARLHEMVGEVSHQLHEQYRELARQRRALADAAGLPPTTLALDFLTPATLADLFARAELPRLPSGRELLERSPALRRMRLEYAVAEALLRDEVVRTRPGLRLGAALDITSHDVLPGGSVVLDLPHALALSGRVEAARQARERVREETEEELRASLARIEQARTEYATARSALEEHAQPRASASSAAWRAALARFAVDPGAAEEIGMALRDSAMALLDLAEVRQQVVRAWLDLEEEIGPEARALPGDEALAGDDATPEVQP